MNASAFFWKYFGQTLFGQRIYGWHDSVTICHFAQKVLNKTMFVRISYAIRSMLGVFFDFMTGSQTYCITYVRKTFAVRFGVAYGKHNGSFTSQPTIRINTSAGF